ncbi:hypothetical protein M2436_006878 [Streptomyces sp. HB372]|nr:hypothetical protein [Streptomyces sp. HB372]
MDLVLLASVGGFFALRTTPVPGGGHRPLEQLYAGDDGPLAARVDKVAARLAAPERRVAASIAHLGLAARLWSLALGPAALFGRIPALTPDAPPLGPVGHLAGRPVARGDGRAARHGDPHP